MGWFVMSRHLRSPLVRPMPRRDGAAVPPDGAVLRAACAGLDAHGIRCLAPPLWRSWGSRATLSAGCRERCDRVEPVASAPRGPTHSSRRVHAVLVWLSDCRRSLDTRLPRHRRKRALDNPIRCLRRVQRIPLSEQVGAWQLGRFTSSRGRVLSASFTQRECGVRRAGRAALPHVRRGRAATGGSSDLDRLEKPGVWQTPAANGDPPAVRRRRTARLLGARLRRGRADGDPRHRRGRCPGRHHGPLPRGRGAGRRTRCRGRRRPHV